MGNSFRFMFLMFFCAINGISQENKYQKIAYWLTKGDKSALLQQQPSLTFGQSQNTHSNIEINPKETFQSIDGFGYTLTGGSAMLINQLNKTQRDNLLKELFGNTSTSIGISYLRISIGASDLDASVFSYDDLAAGQTDPKLEKFSLKPDQNHLIPLLKDIVKINPKIKIMGTSWSPPVWMKTNGNSMGGSLKAEYYEVYAKYFVKYIQAMKAQGIHIESVTIQNEPENDKNNPSMLMTASEQANFIKNNLGPAFRTAKIKTKIMIFDHNCDHPNYPIEVLNDPSAKAFIAGSAFHLYNGDASALSKVHDAHPDKNLYFTEQWTGAKGDFDGDLKWHLKNVIVATLRNWSKNALEWNLANDPNYELHTAGGCNECKGALTIGSTSITRNVSYYIIAHASKFVPAGSVRIGSNLEGNLQNVAFKTPAGKTVLIVENDGNTATVFNIKYSGKWATATLPAGSVATYVW